MRGGEAAIGFVAGEIQVIIPVDEIVEQRPAESSECEQKRAAGGAKHQAECCILMPACCLPHFWSHIPVCQGR